MKLLSIVIPVYNVEPYLKKCLDSVIYPDKKLCEAYEIIVVNDGSTDGSSAILDDYSNKRPDLIRVIAKENGGLGSARNAGLMASEGKYIDFLDSDDWLSENAVLEMLKFCRKREFDICFFNFKAVDEDGTVLETVKGANQNGPFTLESNPEVLLCRVNAWNKLYRRNLFTDNGILYPDRAWYEDVFTTPKLYTKAKTMIRTDNVWYNYFHRQGSIMNNRNLTRNLEIIDAVDAMNSYYKDNGLFEKYHDQLEYFTYYNELLVATVRVNWIDPFCKEQDRLLEYFLEHFPDYRNNPYIKNMSKKYKFLNWLVVRKKRRLHHFIIKLNDRIRH